MIFPAKNFGPGVGFFADKIDGRIINRTGAALVKGKVYMLDLAASDGDVSTVAFGDENSVWGNVIVPSAAGILVHTFAILCVSLDIPANDAKGRVRFFGKVDAFQIAASGNIAINTELVSTAGAAGNLDAVLAANEKIVAIGQEALTTPTTATLADAFFYGFGSLRQRT